MKKYVKPSINVIELQLKENIAAVPTTVYKGSTRENAIAQKRAVSMALSALGTGLDKDGDYTVS
ncbi:MAG: hypothetical protein IJC10_02750 [Clostridia bacterium]|nr:hypothetical protein [Clostridia bacterium]